MQLTTFPADLTGGCPIPFPCAPLLTPFSQALQPSTATGALVAPPGSPREPHGA